MREHVKKEYCTCDGAGTCNGCCLFICSICNGAECSLTTECVGRELTYDEEKLICDGKLDFVSNAWVNSQP